MEEIKEQMQKIKSERRLDEGFGIMKDTKEGIGRKESLPVPILIYNFFNTGSHFLTLLGEVVCGLLHDARK